MLAAKRVVEMRLLPIPPKGGEMPEENRDPYTGYPVDENGEVLDFDTEFELAAASFDRSEVERLFDKIA